MCQCTTCGTYLESEDEIYVINGNEVCYDDKCLSWLISLADYKAIRDLVDIEGTDDFASVDVKIADVEMTIYKCDVDDSFYYTTKE